MVKKIYSRKGEMIEGSMGYGWGKVILLGEHFVVHGMQALVAALPMKTVATIKKSNKSSSYFLDQRPKVPHFKPTKTDKYQMLLENILLFLSIKEPVEVILEGDLLVTSGGIGASGATAVALVRALNQAFCLALSDEKIHDAALVGERVVHGNPSGIDTTAAMSGGVFLFQKNKKKIVSSCQSEYIPSDAKHCTEGYISSDTLRMSSGSTPHCTEGLLSKLNYFSPLYSLFVIPDLIRDLSPYPYAELTSRHCWGRSPSKQSNSGSSHFFKQSISLASSLDLVLVDSGKVSDTKTVIAQVNDLKIQKPHVMDEVFKRYENLVSHAYQALTRDDLKTFGQCMNDNHTLLQEIGVSSPELDHMATTARQAGAWGAKLTGTGQGGLLVALTPGKKLQDDVASSFQKQGYFVIKT